MYKHQVNAKQNIYWIHQWSLFWRFMLIPGEKSTHKLWHWKAPVIFSDLHRQSALWRHQMETFSALLAICADNSPVTDEFPAQRPVTRSFDIFFDLRLNKRLSKQSWGWWFETPSRPLLRHCNVLIAHVPLMWYRIIQETAMIQSSHWKSSYVSISSLLN